MKLVYNDTSHSYWLDGKRVKSASKVAQIASDSFTIEQWRGRQHVIGMTLDPTLRERAAVDLDNREAIQQIADDALNAAKANARAQRGTQRHRVFELGLLGRQDQFITDQQVEDWKVLERTLDAYQLEPIPDRVEQFIAWPEHGVVGRYDAYLYHHALGMPVLVDLKGGVNAVKYPHSTAVQLWLYRNAPHTSAAIKRDGDKSEVTEWTTAPDGAEQDAAYVIYCDDHHDVGELWRINLDAARSGGELALGVVNWRKAYNYGREIATFVAPKNSSESQPAVEAGSLDKAARGVTDEATTCSVAGSTGRPQASPQSTPPSVDATAADSAWRFEAKRRYDLLNDTQKAEYTRCKADIDTTNRDQVFALIAAIDPFNTVIETAAPEPTPSPTPVRPPTPDEGDTVDPQTIAALRQTFEALPDTAQLWISTLTAQGRTAGVDWRTGAKPSVRRYELGRAVIKLAEHLERE